MIAGIRIVMTTDEVKDHVLKRHEYHTEKAAWYTKQIAALKAGGLTAESSTADPVSSLECQRDVHNKKAGYFAVLAKHLIPNEQYQLAENDLTKLELIGQMW